MPEYKTCSVEKNVYVLFSSMTEFGITYGFRLFESGVPVITVYDLSPDRPFSERLVSLFNEYQPELVHLWDIIEDMLP